MDESIHIKADTQDAKDLTRALTLTKIKGLEEYIINDANAFVPQLSTVGLMVRLEATNEQQSMGICLRTEILKHLAWVHILTSARNRISTFLEFKKECKSIMQIVYHASSVYRDADLTCA